jgi:hypothetical protein
MPDIYLEVEDYLWFAEYQQGNVNVAGLVFDDLIEETLDLGPEEVLTVYSDVLEETLDFSDDPRDVGGQHWATVNDIIALAELFGGAPIRVKQSVLNVVYTKPVMPIKIAHMHLDVVMSGSDTFMEEVSSELQAHSTYANAVPYYWELCQESFGIDLTEPQPRPPITLALKLLTTDLVNMRHEVIQDYLFNSTCLDSFFIWPEPIWGWDKLIAESLANTDALKEIIGKLADEYLYLTDAMIAKFLGLHIINDTVFAFDKADAERFYLCLAEDAITIADGEVSFVTRDAVAGETLGISDAVFPQIAFTGLATESLVFTDISTFVHELIIEEGIALEDVDLARWVHNVLVELNFDIADIIA